MSHRRVVRLFAGVSAAALVLTTAGPALACFTQPPCSTPSISTQAVSGVVGQSIYDVATVSGGNRPSGSLTWRVYSSSDKWCSRPLFTTAAVTVKGDGSYTSPAFMPGSVGGYQWVATYSGDYRNSPVSTRCNDPNEQSVVSKARPSLSTTASAPVTLGQPIGDTAVLSGGVSPTGSITWNLYAAGTNCATSLFTSSAVPVSGDGTYTSPAYRPTAAGTYQWVATYSGDPNNSTFTSWCNESSEQSVVQAPVTPPTTPTPATTPTPPAAPETTVAKQAVAPIKIFRCGPHKVKKDKKVHGKTVTVCVAKKRAPARRHAPAPTFTG